MQAANWNGGFLHLSVNHEGRVSLWDTQRKAMDGKEDGEITLELPLTDEQMSRIKDSASRARAPRLHNGADPRD